VTDGRTDGRTGGVHRILQRSAVLTRCKNYTVLNAIVTMTMTSDVEIS